MILCVGTTPVLQRSMIFQRLRIDEVNRAIEVSEYPSGKSINVARVAHTLGEAVLVTGFLGGDSGKVIRDELGVAGVPHDFVSVAPETRMCVTLIDRDGGEVTELVEEAKAVEADAWDQLDRKIEMLLPRAKLLVLSGSLPPGAPQEFYKRCVLRAREAGVEAIIDGSGEPLRHALAARPLVVKPNRAELARTLNVSIESEDSLRDAIRSLIESGPTWAVVTEGKAGAMVSDGKSYWRVRSPQVKAINPIGSGDALAAGLACAIARGEKMPDACKLAVACGAANAMTERAGFVRPEDVEALRPQITVESL